jgi:hypothetical protein
MVASVSEKKGPHGEISASDGAAVRAHAVFSLVVARATRCPTYIHTTFFSCKRIRREVIPVCNVLARRFMY